MACIYIFNGHTFNSELELDSFILGKYKYYELYGDLVFSSTESLMRTKSELERIRNASQVHWDTYMRAAALNKKYYDEFGEWNPDLKPPYIGVNKYLSRKLPSGERYVPEFVDDAYWDKMFDNWQGKNPKSLGLGMFGELELELFGVQPNDTIWTEEECNKRKETILQKWEAQAKSGTAVHNVLQLYFSETIDPADRNRKYVFELSNPKQYILENLKTENKEFLTDDIINSTMDYAVKLHNKLKTMLRIKPNERLEFFPEFVINTDLADSSSEKYLIGFVDLLVMDPSGTLHIVDYKTSIKDYSKYHSTKVLGYKYLLATYRRMFEYAGFNTFNSTINVCPIKLDNFRLDGTNPDGTDKYVFDSISSDIICDNITTDNMTAIIDNIDEFLAPKVNFHITIRDGIEEAERFIRAVCPEYTGNLEITEESTKEWLDILGKLEKNNEGKYTFYNHDDKVSIETDDEVEFIKRVTDYRKKIGPKRIRVAGDIKRLLRDAIDAKNSDVAWPTPYKTKEGESIEWMKSMMSPYCNGEWEVVDNLDLEGLLGVITVINKRTKTVDYIRISTNYLYYNMGRNRKQGNPGYGRMGLTGCWETDALANSRPNSLMMEAARGNVELMELMAVLNISDGMEGFKIGSMQVINPFDKLRVKPNNQELQYCFNAINYFNKMKWNKFQTGEILFLNSFEQALRLFLEIMTLDWQGTSQVDRFFTKMKSCKSMLDDVATGTVLEKIDALNKLRQKMEQEDLKVGKFNTVYKLAEQLTDSQVFLYNKIVTTIAELLGIINRQLLSDHGKWFLSILKIPIEGLQGSKIDNPGNLSSQTLNKITSLLTEAYLNTRAHILREKTAIDKYVKAIKEEANFGYVKENIGFNLASLYSDMFEERDGDLFFVNPNKLPAGAKRNFLEYALEKINENRYGDKYLAKIAKDNNDPTYYRVPLARGSGDSVVSARGMLKGMREKLREYNPQTVMTRMLQKLEGVGYNEEETSTFVFNMTNMFDAGESEKRLEYIQKVGIHNLERNLETLLLLHIFAYSQAENINKVFPLIKAAAIHLQYEGVNKNDYFEKDLGYIKDYVWNKVLNKSLINPELKEVNAVANSIKQAATKLMLGFSPVQGIYLHIQGLWQNISLWIRKPGNNQAFSFKNFAKAYKIVYSEMLDFSGKPTVCSRLNELYGINDMDMNTYIQRITKNRKGLYNFDNMLFKFSSRPDYYNRMVILVAQMLEDGSFYAHSIDKDGNLVYDISKDERFSKFVANPKGTSPEIAKQKSLYYSIALQFMKENAVDNNGDPFVMNLDKPTLPRAYTTLQMEGIKSLADDIYGYYTHEKKSMMMSEMIGSMWMHFKTYWSGKKNLYLQSGGTRLRGSFEHYTEMINGEEIKWYYQVDSNGYPLFNEPPIPDKKPYEGYEGDLATEDKRAYPVMQWRGQWQEGIMVSLAQLCKHANFRDNWDDLWNNLDINLRNSFRNNIKQLGFDLFMFLVVGTFISGLLADWLKDLEDDNKKNKDIVDGCYLSMARIGVMSLSNSTLDFNMVNSIGEPLQQWTPIALQWSSRSTKEFWNAAIGEKDWYDWTVNLFAATRQTKSIWNALKPDRYRTKQEGGTWESATARKNREKRERENFLISQS